MWETGEDVTLKVACIDCVRGISVTSLREIAILQFLSQSACNVVNLHDVEHYKKKKHGELKLEIVFLTI